MNTYLVTVTHRDQLFPATEFVVDAVNKTAAENDPRVGAFLQAQTEDFSELLIEGETEISVDDITGKRRFVVEVTETEPRSADITVWAKDEDEALREAEEIVCYWDADDWSRDGRTGDFSRESKIISRNGLAAED